MFNVLDKSMFIETLDPHVDSRLRSLYLSEGYFLNFLTDRFTH